MKQGNNNNSCSTCSCDYLQLHLLPAPKSLFSERFNVRVMSIIWFIAWRKRSIPTHSGWLYPLTFDAGKGLKEA